MNRYVDNWFHFYDTVASFQAHLNGGFINPDAICFIGGEAHQIYAQGHLFGICKKRYEELEALVQKHDLLIKNIIGEEGPSVNNGIIDNLREITDFLAGFAPDENLKEVLSIIENRLREQIVAVAEDLASKYQELTTKISNLTDALLENVELLDAKIAANAAGITELRIKQEALDSTLKDHIREWQEFKAAYDIFHDYVDDRFHTIDDNYHAQQESIIRMHDEIEAIKATVNEFDAKVEHCITLVNNCHVLVDRVEAKFDDLANDVADFFNTKGHPNGLAPLDADGKVPSTHLPSYVDDVLEFSSANAFPAVGEDGKIYVAIDTNLTYRWSGTQYIEISKSLGLGETSSTAYPGDKGKLTTDTLAAHMANYNNPHKVNVVQLGLDKVNNTSDEDKPVSTAQAAAIKVVQDDITSHKNNKSNPHEVTKAQVGLSNVDNTADVDKPISSATQAAINVLTTSLNGHISDETNPHNVTKEQLGLGNVENTADKDKPLSDAAINMFDTKVDKIIGKGLSTNDFTNEDKTKLDNSMTNRKLTTEEINQLETKNVGDLIFNTDLNKFVFWNGSEWVEQAVGTDTDTKVDKEEGKGLSSNDYTDAEKEKLAKLQGSVVALTQAQYNALTTKDSQTLYVVD